MHVRAFHLEQVNKNKKSKSPAIELKMDGWYLNTLLVYITHLHDTVQRIKGSVGCFFGIVEPNKKVSRYFY